MQRRRKLLTSAALVASVLAALAATVASGGTKAAQTLVIGAADVSRTLSGDSAYIPDTTGRRPVYEGLLRLATKPNDAKLGGGFMVDPDRKKYTPLLATDWSVSPDNTVWTFNLRKGVKSGVGNEFTSEDVKWSIDRSIAIGSTGGLGLKFTARVLSVDTPSKYVVTFTTNGPNAVFLARTASISYFPIYDSVEAKKHATATDPWAKDWLNQNAVGFGPYTITSWTKGQSMTFTARPDYWGPKPYYSTVTILAIPDPASRLAALKQGSIQVAIGLSPDLIRDVRKDDKLKVTEFNGNNQVVLYPNYNFAPLKDRRVRQAIAHAIPYDDIIKGVYFGTASTMKTPVPPYVPYATERYWRYATDIPEAKRLMAAAGYANGFEIPLSYANEHPELDPVVAAIQQSLAQIGIKVTLDKQPESILVGRALGPHDLPLYISNTGSPEAPDPSAVIAFFTRTNASNVTNYVNPAIEKLQITVLTTLTPSRRAQLIYQAQKILETDLPFIWLFTFHEAFASTKAIQGITWSTDHSTLLWPLKGA